jgi:O-antigen/teichoic acid export membrane protein
MALLALRNDVSRALFGTTDDAALIVLIAASLVPMNTARFLTETMRIRFQATHFLIAAVITAIASGAAGVIGVVLFDGGPAYVLLGIAIGSTMAAIYGFAVVSDSLHGRIWRFELRRMLAYGIPLIPSGLAAWALAFADRIILANLRDLQEVGEYAVASRLSLVLIIGSTAFLLALWPLLLSTHSENPERERATRGRTLTYLTFVLCCGALIITLAARELLEVVAPGYDDAYKAVGPLSLGGVAYALSALLMTGILISRRTIHLAAFALLAAGVNIALNLALVPPFGFVGSAVGTAVGYGVLAVAYYRVAQRLYRTPYEPVKVVSIVVAAALCSLLGLLSLESLALEFVLKLVGFAAFLGLTWASGAIRGAELEELRRFGRAMVPRVRAPSG